MDDAAAGVASCPGRNHNRPHGGHQGRREPVPAGVPVPAGIPTLRPCPHPPRRPAAPGGYGGLTADFPTSRWTRRQRADRTSGIRRPGGAGRDDLPVDPLRVGKRLLWETWDQPAHDTEPLDTARHPLMSPGPSLPDWHVCGTSSAAGAHEPTGHTESWASGRSPGSAQPAGRLVPPLPTHPLAKCLNATATWRSVGIRLGVLKAQARTLAGVRSPFPSSDVPPPCFGPDVHPNRQSIGFAG